MRTQVLLVHSQTLQCMFILYLYKLYLNVSACARLFAFFRRVFLASASARAYLPNDALTSPLLPPACCCH